MPNVPADLAAKLRDHAKGWLPAEAAVDLLIAHDIWLHEPDFVARCVVEDRHFLDDRPIAYIDWERPPSFTARVGAASSANQVLLIAAELAGVTTSRSLTELLSGLDDTNTRLVCDAIAHHNGLHQRGGR